MARLLVIFLFLLNSSFAQYQDSLLCNMSNSTTDRLLLYDKDCFLWISQNTTSKEMGPMLVIAFGQFKAIGDTIYFTYPDSTRAKNKYYCYGSYKGYSSKEFHIYNVPETWPPGSIDRVYKDIFKTTAPDFGEIGIFVNFKAIRRNDKVIFLTHNDPNDLTKEFIFCNQ